MACPYSGQVPLSPSQSLSTSMKAAVVTKFGKPDVLQIQKIPVPQPKDNEVLIKVLTVGINPIDTVIRAGDFHSSPQLPYVPGGDVGGFVQATGKNVTKFQLGQRVFTVMAKPTQCGGCAEYMAIDEDFVFPLHDNLSYSQAAAVGIPYSTAYITLFMRAQVKPGQTVLIHGASGGVGLASCQLARAHGMIVLGTAGTEEGLEVVKKNGAHAVFNHRKKGYHLHIQEYTNGKGVDVILECLANKNLSKDLDLIANRGKIMIIDSMGNVSINPGKAMAKQCCIEGFLLFETSKSEWSEIGAALCAGMEQGSIKPVIDQGFLLSEVDQAHTEVIQHTQGTKGKIIVSL